MQFSIRIITALVCGLLWISYQTCAQVPLATSYTFLGRQGKTTHLWQQHDTLFSRYQPPVLPPDPMPAQRYRILQSTQIEEFRVLQVESLDSIPFSANPWPENRFSIIVLRNVTPQQLGYYDMRLHLTRPALGTVPIIADSLRRRFFFTYYSSAYLETLRQLPAISTKEQAERVLTEIQRPSTQLVAAAWRATDSGDLYATGLIQEILNQACIRAGVSPWKATEHMEKFRPLTNSR